MPESFPFQPGLLKGEASGALCIWLWGPEASRGEASATPGSPPGLLFDFNLIRDFFFSNPALPETVLEMQWVSQRNAMGVPKKQLACFPKTRNLEFPAPSCRPPSRADLWNNDCTKRSAPSCAEQPDPATGKNPGMTQLTAPLCGREINSNWKWLKEKHF